MPCSEARKFFGKDFIIGVSCQNSQELALKAYNEGADYIAIGSIFKTNSKLDPSKASIEDLNYISTQIPIPIVAIGGININNINQLSNTSAKMVAISEGLYATKEPKIITNDLINNFKLNS